MEDKVKKTQRASGGRKLSEIMEKEVERKIIMTN